MKILFAALFVLIVPGGILLLSCLFIARLAEALRDDWSDVDPPEGE